MVGTQLMPATRTRRQCRAAVLRQREKFVSIGLSAAKRIFCRGPLRASGAELQGGRHTAGKLCLPSRRPARARDGATMWRPCLHPRTTTKYNVLNVSTWYRTRRDRRSLESWTASAPRPISSRFVLRAWRVARGRSCSGCCARPREARPERCHLFVIPLVFGWSCRAVLGWGCTFPWGRAALGRPGRQGLSPLGRFVFWEFWSGCSCGSRLGHLGPGAGGSFASRARWRQWLAYCRNVA